MTPYTPDARGAGGAAHEFELIRLASQDHEIEVVSADLPEAGTQLDVGERGVPITGTTWRRRRAADTRVGFASQFVRAWPSYDQWLLADRLRALSRAIRFHERRRCVDLVHFTSIEMASLARSAVAPTALLAFDVFSRQSKRERQIAGSPERRLRWWVEERRLTWWERRWCSRIDGLAAVSDVDAAVMRALSSRPVHVIPNPVGAAYFAPPDVDRSARIVTFIANLEYRPNVDAVEWLANEIWPRVLRVVPDAQLAVVGSRPTPAVRAAVARSGGEVYADVPDVRPYYWQAAVAVAPVRLGSGLRNKVLHSMACRAPLVATSASLEGIAVEPGRHLLVADHAETFAAAIVESLFDADRATARAAAAAEVVEAYRAERIGAEFSAWWETTVATSARPLRPDRTRTCARAAEAVAPVPKTATVVVCTRDRPELLRRSLPCINRAVEGDGRAELIIVEQGEHHAVALCRELRIAATVIRDDGRGASRARNIGAHHATGDVVLFTDDDAVVPATWVSDHLRVCCAAGVTASCGPVEGISRFSIDRSTRDRDPAALRASHMLGTPPWLIGHSANMAVLRSALLEVGGFDERLGPGASRNMGEDADLIVRLLHSGGRVLSGTGEPVSHLDWRSDEETRRNLVAYERGAGAWIGKMLRIEPSSGAYYLRARAQLLRRRVASEPGVLAEPATVVGSLTGFGRGLLFGIRSGRWKPAAPVAVTVEQVDDVG